MWSCEIRYVDGSVVRCESKDRCVVRGFVGLMMRRGCEVKVWLDDKLLFVYYEFYVCGGREVGMKGDVVVVWGVWEKVCNGENVVVKENVVGRVVCGCDNCDVWSLMWEFWKK